MKIVIAAMVLSDGDAVGHDVIEQCASLREEGIDVFIFAQSCASKVINCLQEKELFAILKEKDSILIYHYSIYWERGTEIMKYARGKRIIKYHNITPEHFFAPYSMAYFARCCTGRNKIHEFRDSDMLMVDSPFNALDFRRAGFPEDRIRILPPFNKIHDFETIKEDAQTAKRLSDGKINVLFVGRVFPNKGHKHIIRTAFYYKLLFGGNIRFSIVGGSDPRLTSYMDELRKLTDFLNVYDIVDFAGKVSLETLKSYYRNSHLFLLLSEHEGFCVPIVESQYFRLPIVAYGSSAIKETVGANQLIYDDIDYEIFASSIDTLWKDGTLRSLLAEEGYKNFLKYKRSVLKEKFLSCIRELGV